MIANGRRWPRRRVRRDAELRRGDDLYVGTILDVSDGGAFFRPEAGVIDGVFTQLESDDDPRLPVGATVYLREDEGGSPPTRAIVRWEGRKERSRGLGLDIGR